jgi:tetratricopeptide (TPR) repeat protein
LNRSLQPGEREYFLGETARAAGGVNRLLGRRTVAREWLDRSEHWFGQIANAKGCFARVAYHRLAIALEERDFGSVTTALPFLIETFEALQLPEEVLKCRFLRSLVLTERDELAEARDELRQIIAEARRLGEDGLLAYAYVNLAQIYALLGDVQETTSLTREATRLLKQGGKTTALPKAHLSIGYLLRSGGENQAAIEAFRNAQQEFASLGMQTNVIDIHLMVADLLVELGRQSEAAWEVHKALPLIEACKPILESLAAMTLLRESLRRQQIDRQALHTLQSHLKEPDP